MAMAALSVVAPFVFALFAQVQCAAGDVQPSLQCSGSSFFDCFDFWTADDPTNGYVDYVGQEEAEQRNLTEVDGEQVVMRADASTVASGRGRKSIRVTSKQAFTDGWFILDLSHMPAGCGTWPAFWLVGDDWPKNGEIDIIEGVNNQTAVQTTLHTSNGCVSTTKQDVDFTGVELTSNCYVKAAGQSNNAGCAIKGPDNSYGRPLNAQGGGVFATKWTGDSIKSWFFPRGQVPANIDSPDASGWGLPYAAWKLGSACPASHFQQLRLVFDLTFCGDWCGNVFAANCPGLGSCTDYVRNNPEKFTEAYWKINSLKVFEASTTRRSARCKAHRGCKGLSGSCCPDYHGHMLDCCDPKTSASPPADGDKAFDGDGGLIVV